MARIILDTTFLCECIIVYAVNAMSIRSGVHAIYVPATQVANDTAKSYKMNDTLNSCPFGKIHGVLERNICFGLPFAEKQLCSRGNISNRLKALFPRWT